MRMAQLEHADAHQLATGLPLLREWDIFEIFNRYRVLLQYSQSGMPGPLPDRRPSLDWFSSPYPSNWIITDLCEKKNEYHISSSRLSSHDGIQTKETRIFFHQSNNRLEWRTCNCSCREDPSGPLIEYFYHPKAQKSSYESRMSKRNGSKNHTPR